MSTTNNNTVTVRSASASTRVEVAINPDNPQSYRAIVEFALPDVNLQSTNLTVIHPGTTATESPSWDTPAQVGDMILLTNKVGNGNK